MDRGPDFVKMYFESLSSYFDNKETVYFWFKSGYEEILAGMGKSYFPTNSRGNVIHTDFGSPLATRENQKNHGMDEDGNRLWFDLESYLSPDVILASINSKYFDTIKDKFSLTRVNDFSFVSILKKNGEKRKSQYVVELWHSEHGRRKWLVYHPLDVQIPFNNISHAEKRRLGKNILSFIESKNSSS